MNARDKLESLWSDVSDADRVAPSKIGSQFYCEKKVDLEQELGDVETPEKQRGTETHEKAAEDAVEIEFDEMWDSIERGEGNVILETMFLGEAADFMVVGMPDAVVFEDVKPQMIFDRKTTSNPGYLFKNQRIQVWLYGFMFDSLDFSTDELQLCILSHEQTMEPTEAKALQRLTLDGEWDEGTHELGSNPEAILHVHDYDPTTYIEDLDWALEYWRGERDPIPTTKPAKCRACVYNDVCADSKA